MKTALISRSCVGYLLSWRNGEEETIKQTENMDRSQRLENIFGEYEIGLRSPYFFVFIMGFSRFIGSLKDLRICESGSAEVDTW